MSGDWVNWQEFSAMQRPEIARMTEEQQLLQRQQQAQMDASLGDLSSEANQRARDGNFAGVQNLGGYGEVMRARDASMASTPRVPGALERPAWEQDLTHGQPAYSNPWSQLSARLSAGTNKANQQSNAANQAKAKTAQDAETKRFNDTSRAKHEQATGGQRKSEADDYAKWSDAVNASSERTGGYGAGAWYDWQQHGGQRPAHTKPSSPLTRRTQDYTYAASPTNTDSNFGLNSGYSSGNSWNF